MFVPHEPYNCFDVYRSNDRCVCGCSAVATSHSGEDRGYCSRCSEKRKAFADNIIGEINIGEKNSTNRKVLIVLEEMRKSIFRERLYYMIDAFFGDQQNDNTFVTPYEDDSFIASVYSEKLSMMNLLSSSIKIEPSITSKFKSSKKDVDKYVSSAYQYYINELLAMKEMDIDELSACNSRIGGYEYTRKFTHKSK